MTRQYANSMQCPRCHSGYTQSVEVAYSQAVRTGETGHTTISEFGRSMEPPAPRNTIGGALAATFMVTVISMMSLPALAEFLGIGRFAALSTFDTPVVVTSLVVGLVAGFRSAVSAYIYNVSIHRGEMQHWGRGVICRRCGHRFRRPRS